MSTKRAILTQGHGLMNGGRPSGWYPDPHDTGGLRYWNGRSWTEHRARLAIPSNTPSAAVCSCGVVATGTCQVCARPFCRAHISEIERDDRAFLSRWAEWTCLGCIEAAQRAIRSSQLQRCEDVAIQIALMRSVKGIRTITGHKPRLVDLFHRSDENGPERPARHTKALLIQYDGATEDATFRGLAISQDGRTVYDVGVPFVGVRRDRVGPKRSIRGYLITEDITIDRLRIAAARSTKENWFEFAARIYLRAAGRLDIGDLPVVPAPQLPVAVEQVSIEEESIEQASIDHESLQDMSFDLDADLSGLAIAELSLVTEPPPDQPD